MKKSIYILFCLFIFPLFLNASQVNAQGPDISHCAQLEPTAARPACEAKAFDQPVSADGHPPTAAPRYENHGTSPDPKLIMDAATVTQPLHDRIGQLESQLSEATATHEPTLNTMKADYERQLSDASTATAALNAKYEKNTAMYSIMCGNTTNVIVGMEVQEVVAQ
jgi:hypothetical protein